MKAKKRYLLLVVSILLVIYSSACSITNNGTEKPSKEGKSKKNLIYFLVPTSDVFRVTKFDIPNIKAAIAEQAPDATLKVLNADGSASKQLAQVETAISEGATGIILMSADSQQTAGILDAANNAKVPVVTIAHEAFGGKVNYHVSVPFLQIGQEQAKVLAAAAESSSSPIKLAKIYGDPKYAFYTDLKKGHDEYLNPLIEQGKIKVVCKADAMSWGPAEAQKAMEQCLTKNKNQIDAAIVMNDDNGGGVSAALAAEGLAGKVKLYGGYDATLEGIQRILTGWQESDLIPPYKQMASAAVTLLLDSINGKEPPKGLINGTFDNKFVKGGIPTAYLPNITINSSNIQKEIIDGDVYKKDQLCSGFAKDSDFCK